MTLQKHDKTIAVLMGGLSAERDISLQSGQAMAEALTKRGYKVTCIDVGPSVAAELVQLQPAAVVLALHGRYGEDGCIQGLLELLKIPYSGCSVCASAVAMDKVLCKRLLIAAGLPTPAWGYPASIDDAMAMGLPVVVKPRADGSSIGVTVVRDKAALTAALAEAEKINADSHKSGALIEQFIPGREFSAAVWGYGEATKCLGIVEIKPKDGVYDYEAKYVRDDTQYIVPAPVSKRIATLMSSVAIDVHRLLDCSGATRVDFRWDEQREPQVLEINTLPGMTSHSLYPMIAASVGISFEDLMVQIVEDARLKA